jgi:copper chaperone NosL
VKNQHKISTLSRAILLLGGIALLAVIILPIWRIELIAPQYPEGLELLIYSNNLGGQVDIINGLNHYIGMKVLNVDDFIEFKVLPYIIAVYAALFLFTGLLGRRKMVYVLFGLFLLFGIVAMVDFYIWLYDYGHNLDPNAAIKVPGMAYQPPLLGYKVLLNFIAFSIPDTGGWIFIGCGIALAFVVFMEWKAAKKRLTIE